MKKMILLVIVVMVLSGCSTPKTKVVCTIYPEPNKESQINVGQSMIQKEVCGSQKQWRGLAGGGTVTVTECGMAELIYLGKFGDAIRFGYREFVKDMARPAYSMEVTYPATTGKLVFRNTVLQITEIGSTYIKYMLISTPTEKCEEIHYK